MVPGWAAHLVCQLIDAARLVLQVAASPTHDHALHGSRHGESAGHASATMRVRSFPPCRKHVIVKIRSSPSQGKSEADPFVFGFSNFGHTFARALLCRLRGMPENVVGITSCSGEMADPDDAAIQEAILMSLISPAA